MKRILVVTVVAFFATTMLGFVLASRRNTVAASRRNTLLALDAKQAEAVLTAKKETTDPCTRVFIRVIPRMYDGQQDRVIIAGEEVSLYSSLHLYLDGDTMQVVEPRHPREGPDVILRRQRRQDPDPEVCKDNPYYKRWLNKF